MAQNGTMKILLDTNVWLDRLLPGRKGYEAAREIMESSIDADAELLYAMHTLNDVFFEVGASIKRWVRASYGGVSEQWAHVINDRCWECVDDITSVASAVGADGPDVFVARHLRALHADFEDDMVLAAAKRAEVDYLVTSDRQLIQKADVVALTPEDMLVVLRERLALRQGC
jgi:predicted nucleic acid-binding protein